VFAFADVMNFFAHELSRLRARRFTLAGVSTRTFDGLFLWHCPLLSIRRVKPAGFPRPPCDHNPDG